MRYLPSVPKLEVESPIIAAKIREKVTNRNTKGSLNIVLKNLKKPVFNKIHTVISNKIKLSLAEKIIRKFLDSQRYGRNKVAFIPVGIFLMKPLIVGSIVPMLNDDPPPDSSDAK